MRAGNVEEAIDLFEQATATDPHFLPAYFNLSDLYRQNDLLLDPNSYEARLANAVYLGKQGKRLPALRELRQLVSDRDSPILVKERARQLIEMLQQ